MVVAGLPLCNPSASRQYASILSRRTRRETATPCRTVRQLGLSRLWPNLRSVVQPCDCTVEEPSRRRQRFVSLDRHCQLNEGAVEDRLAAAVDWPPLYHAHGSAYTHPCRALPSLACQSQHTKLRLRVEGLEGSEGLLQGSTFTEKIVVRYRDHHLVRGWKALSEHTPLFPPKGGG